MSCHKLRHTVLGVLVGGVIFLSLSGSGLAANPMLYLNKSPKKTEAKAPPEKLTAANIDKVIAGMSDEQVRQLLIDEFKKQAAAEAAAAKKTEKPGGFNGFVEDIKAKAAFAKNRIEMLKQSRDSAFKDLDTKFQDKDRGRENKPLETIIIVAAIFLGAGLIEFLFGFLTRAARQRIAISPQKTWYGKMGASALLSGIELIHMLIFFLAAICLFYIFVPRTHTREDVLTIYMIAFLIVRLTQLGLRYVLVPKMPALRLLPFSDQAALYLYRGIMVFAVVGSFGLLSSAVAHLFGANEFDVFMMAEAVGIITSLIVIWMIIQKRKDLMEVMGRNLPEGSIRARMVNHWHYFAILIMILIYLFSLMNHLLGIVGKLEALQTMGLIALYLFLDWLLKKVLKMAFGITDKGAVVEAAGAGPDVGVSGQVQGANQTTRPLSIDRMQIVLRRGLRIALAASFFFGILSVWHVNLPIGEAVVNAAFDILAVVVICYVIWELINTAISRKLEATMTEMDEDQEEGGAGGSRAGTLLLLLRKFMLVVMVVLVAMIGLSRMGIDIGPLIAGAGVIGLAIGFGAQTLVKDIISGVFFLLDDAFRVGDYIEVGNAKGMVEHISLRSFKLRHPRGMVNTIPFGNINSVTNMSRDYIISKLDFRVRYDADVDKIRKIIKKKVYKEIIKDKDLAAKLLGKIKSQGVRELDDSAMIMRVKFKTVPGEQFVIRKEVFRLMQEAFQEAGIEFAHKNVTVYLPPEVKEAAQKDPQAKEKILKAGTAAAAASLEAEKPA